MDQAEGKPTDENVKTNVENAPTTDVETVPVETQFAKTGAVGEEEYRDYIKRLLDAADEYANRYLESKGYRL